MIATLKALGLAAEDFATVVAAARRVVEYLQGAPVTPVGPAVGGYYAGSGEGDGSGRDPGVSGRAWGAAAGLVGLSGVVSGEQLERVLTGRHAVSGVWLLPARGSAGRRTVRDLDAGLAERLAAVAGASTVMSLEQAARFAGVNVRYLRRLAQEQALRERTVTSAQVVNETGVAVVEHEEAAARLGEVIGPPEGRAFLRASREAGSGRWVVEREELARFVADRRPPTVVIGFDLVCSAPKSVSVLWAFGDEELRADVAAAMDAGVGAALSYLERYAAVGTVAGRNRPGLGLAAACYRHEVSRADEAHLHVHNVIVNAVPVPLLDDDGAPVLDERGVGRVVWRALDSEVLHAHVKTAGYVGAAVLRHELSRRRGIGWEPVRNGVAEVAGMPRSLLEVFSSRTGQVEEEFLRLVEDGFAADAATHAAAQRGSRAPKRVLADTQVRAIQHRRLVEAGWRPEQVRALAPPGGDGPASVGEAEVAVLFDRVTGPRGVSEQQPLFTRRDAVRQVAAWAGDRLDAEQIDRLTDRLLADPRIVHVTTMARRRRNQPEPTYTTVDLLEAEQSLLALYRQGQVTCGGSPRAVIDPHLVQAAIARLDRRLAAAGDALSGEQSELVRRVLSCGDLVRVVTGPAGSGKTEALRAVTAAFTDAGYTVVGSANGGRQAEELHARLGVPTLVVTGWLTMLDHTPDPAEAWPHGTVLIVDEATQIATRDAERLLRYATRTGTVVILVGDPAQLGSVGAGGWFTHLATTDPDPIALTANQRQRGEDLAEVREALAELRTRLPADTHTALARLAADRRIRLFDTREQLLATAVHEWHHDRQRETRTEVAGRSRMLAEHHRDTELLNTAARTLLHADGTLHGPVLRVTGRQFQVGDEVITLTQAGHTLVPAGQPRSDYVRTGSIGVVNAVHLDPDQPGRQALTVDFPSRGQVRVGWDYLTHAFTDGRDGGLAHAYALTAHKAEGATLPTARALVADDTSAAGLYVMLTRGRDDVQAYLIRRADLTAHLDDEDWLPILVDTTGTALSRLLDRLTSSGPERLAGEHDPIARAAHQLRTRHTLTELTALRRRLTLEPAANAALLVARRAELAAEAALTSAAVTDPPPELLARIGPRPHTAADRIVWDQAVGALAVYRARHQPDVPANQLGPPPVADPDQAELHDRQLRAQAEQLSTAWATRLRPRQRERFHSQTEALPRQRAITGLAALLHAGHRPDELAEQLTADDTATIRSGAAVLAHRVQQLLDQFGVVPAHYELPPALTATDEWEHATRALDAAEARHLARTPTSQLAAEHHQLAATQTAPDPHATKNATTRLTATADATRNPTDATPNPTDEPIADTDTNLGDSRRRIRLVDAALAHQLDQVALRLPHHTPGYLTALLGPRPADPTGADVWDRRALAIEHYRHYALGLSYGTPAAPPSAPAAEQTLGPAPTDPTLHARYHQLLHHITPDLDTAL